MDDLHKVLPQLRFPLQNFGREPAGVGLRPPPWEPGGSYGILSGRSGRWTGCSDLGQELLSFRETASVLEGWGPTRGPPPLGDGAVAMDGPTVSSEVTSIIRSCARMTRLLKPSMSMLCFNVGVTLPKPTPEM